MALPVRTLLVSATLAVALGSCRSQPDLQMPATHYDPPAKSATTAVSLPGLHNVVTYADNLHCGGVPEGDEGFATLASMGIRTVISVDGGTPELQKTDAHGMRYVHLPISYDTVTPERQRQLAQAIVNLEGPIYLHCHHGKHRSAAALGTAMVRAGMMTPDQAMARMHVSGTAASYTGLWAAVREATSLTIDELNADPASFPQVTVVTGMVATMAEIDQVIDLVRQAHDANWRAPDDHPDLVAQKETRRLADLLQSLRDDEESMAYPSDYQELLDQAIEASNGLDKAVRGSQDELAANMLKTLGKTCKACHRLHRNH